MRQKGTYLLNVGSRLIWSNIDLSCLLRFVSFRFVPSFLCSWNLYSVSSCNLLDWWLYDVTNLKFSLLLRSWNCSLLDWMNTTMQLVEIWLKSWLVNFTLHYTWVPLTCKQLGGGPFAPKIEQHTTFNRLAQQSRIFAQIMHKLLVFWDLEFASSS